MLLDKALNEDEIKEIDAIFKTEKKLDSYHYLKTRQSGDDIFIEAHIVFRDKKFRFMMPIVFQNPSNQSSGHDSLELL